MQAKFAEDKKVTVKNGTVDGLNINLYLLAAAVNTTLNSADFFPQDVQISVILSRNGVNHTIVAGNLEVLGVYASKLLDQHGWVKGNTLVWKDTAVKEQRLHNLYIPFDGHINAKEDDVLTCQMVVGRSVFSNDIDSASSFFDFDFNYSVGYEFGIPEIFAQVVLATTPNETYNLGNNVGRVMLLNLDKTDLQNFVMTSVSLTSDKLDATLNSFQLFNRDISLFSPVGYKRRYGATQPALSDEALPFYSLYPQSFTLYMQNGANIMQLLNNTKVALAMNSAQVAASKNYVVCTRFKITADLIARAQARIQKHQGEAASSLS